MIIFDFNQILLIIQLYPDSLYNILVQAICSKLNKVGTLTYHCVGAAGEISLEEMAGKDIRKKVENIMNKHEVGDYKGLLKDLGKDKTMVKKGEQWKWLCGNERFHRTFGRT